MKTRLRTRDYLIIGLEIIDGIMREFQDPGGLVSASYKNMYGFVPKRYKRRSFDALLYRLNRDGFVNKTGKGENEYYSLTEKGKVLARKKVLFNNNRKWDGKIRVIIFDIEEINRRKRNQLREIIKTFGFAMWQISVWVCPRELNNEFYTYFKSISSYACIFDIPAIVVGDLKVFANKVWRIDSLTELYQGWRDDALKYISSREEEKTEREKKKLIKEFFEIVLKDPFLPEEFLPDNWAGKVARGLFVKLNATSK